MPTGLEGWVLRAIFLGWVLGAFGGVVVPVVCGQEERLRGSRVTIGLAPELSGELAQPVSGRLWVVFGPPGATDLRDRLGGIDPEGPPVLARDVEGIAPDTPLTIGPGEGTLAYGLESLAPGTAWSVQAILRTNPDSVDLAAPGNLSSRTVALRLDPEGFAVADPLVLELSRREPPEILSPNTDQVRYLKLHSERLTAFYGRPMYLRAGVILPRDFDLNPTRRYPLRVHIGGFATRYTAVSEMMRPGSEFARAWNADSAPRMILLHLDGDGPLGDPYHIDSANHGPWGSALIEELIPHVETCYRGMGTGQSRVTDGGSTGGWVSLALQVYYPDSFAGCWSFCPDPVDFRSYQRIDIYQGLPSGEPANAYTDSNGQEIPSARDPATGRTRLSVRQEIAIENLKGPGNTYTTSGGQWGAWNAVFSPRGPDGRPRPLWEPATGTIDHGVAVQWRKYDIRHHLETHWPTLGPKLRGKIHIYVGTADDYFLNEAVERLDAFLSRAHPPYEGTIEYGPGAGHCYNPLSEDELLRAMGATLTPAHEAFPQ